jgi:uncharacterized protein (TIGR04255 family)
VPSRHEVYPFAPLALVTAQVTFAYEPVLNDPAARDAFAQQLRERFPVLREETVNTVTMAPGAQPAQIAAHQQIRASNQQQTISVVLNNSSFTIEATEYEHFPTFQEVLHECFASLAQVVATVFVTRAGLRYIDEIRPPGIAATNEWTGWVADALIAPLALLSGAVTASGVTGSAAFQIAEDTGMLFRWGEVEGTTVVAAAAAVKRPTPPQGRFFVLDADAFWQPSAPEPLDVETLTARFATLHEPVSEIFEASLTPHAQALFRGEKIDV